MHHAAQSAINEPRTKSCSILEKQEAQVYTECTLKAKVQLTCFPSLLSKKFAILEAQGLYE